MSPKYEILSVDETNSTLECNIVINDPRMGQDDPTDGLQENEDSVDFAPIPPPITYHETTMCYGFSQVVPLKVYVDGIIERGVTIEDFVKYWLYKETYKNTEDMSLFDGDISNMVFEIAEEEYAKQYEAYHALPPTTEVDE